MKLIIAALLAITTLGLELDLDSQANTNTMKISKLDQIKTKKMTKKTADDIPMLACSGSENGCSKKKSVYDWLTDVDCGCNDLDDLC
jgi:hypothetical protein